jgi:hypothetical protein
MISLYVSGVGGGTHIECLSESYAWQLMKTNCTFCFPDKSALISTIDGRIKASGERVGLGALP